MVEGSHYTCRPNPKLFGIMASQMHKLNLGQPIEESQIPNVDQFSSSTNERPEFVRVIYDPFIMLDAYWTEKKVQGSDLHLGCKINLGFLIWAASIVITILKN